MSERAQTIHELVLKGYLAPGVATDLLTPREPAKLARCTFEELINRMAQGETVRLSEFSQTLRLSSGAWLSVCDVELQPRPYRKQFQAMYEAQQKRHQAAAIAAARPAPSELYQWEMQERAAKQRLRELALCEKVEPKPASWLERLTEAIESHIVAFEEWATRVAVVMTRGEER